MSWQKIITYPDNRSHLPDSNFGNICHKAKVDSYNLQQGQSNIHQGIFRRELLLLSLDFKFKTTYNPWYHMASLIKPQIEYDQC